VKTHWRGTEDEMYTGVCLVIDTHAQRRDDACGAYLHQMTSLTWQRAMVNHYTVRLMMQRGAVSRLHSRESRQVNNTLPPYQSYHMDRVLFKQLHSCEQLKMRDLNTRLRLHSRERFSVRDFQTYWWLHSHKQVRVMRLNDYQQLHSCDQIKVKQHKVYQQLHSCDQFMVRSIKTYWRLHSREQSIVWNYQPYQRVHARMDNKQDSEVINNTIFTDLNDTKHQLKWVSSACFRHALNMMYNSEGEIWKHPYSFKYLSQNVRTLTSVNIDTSQYREKIEALQKHSNKYIDAEHTNVHDQYCHIVFLQETGVAGKDIQAKIDLEEAFPYHTAIVTGIQSKSNCVRGQGLITLVDNEWYKHINYESTKDGRAILIKISTPSNAKVCRSAFLNIYGPSGHASSESKVINNDLSVFIKQSIDSCKKSKHVLTIVGDWNAVINPSLDRIDNQSTMCESKALKVSLDNRMIDAYRLLNPEGADMSFNDISRIDNLLIESDLLKTIQGVQYKNLCTSFDHKALIWNMCYEDDSGPSMTDEYLKYRNEFKPLLDINLTTGVHWDKFNAKCNSAKEQAKITTSLDTGTPILHGDSKEDALKWLANEAQHLSYSLLRVARKTLVYTKLKPIQPDGPRTNRPCKKVKKILKIIRQVKEIIVNQENNANFTLLNKTIDESAAYFNKYNVQFDHIQHDMLDDWIMNTKRGLKTFSKVLRINKTKEQKTADMLSNIEERMIEWSSGKFKQSISTILDRSRDKVKIDKKVLVDDCGIVVEVIDKPDIVKAMTVAEMEKWHGKRNTHLHNMTPLFNEEFYPKADIDPDIYKYLLAEPTMLELKTALSSTKSRAPGLSSINANMIKNSSVKHLELLLLIAAIAFKHSVVPLEWTKGVIYPVPKGPVTWDSSISNTRPITLLEVPRKIVLKILTTRLSKILLDHNVLKGNNPSVLPGTCTDDVIHLVNSAMNDARKNNKECWIILQDMKRAFDSVDNEALVMSMRRLKLPEKYIELYSFINKHRTNCVITAYGNTPSYHPEAGLDQGGVECPLHWRIFYDTLLCYIKSNHIGYQMNNTMINPVDKSIKLSSLSITGSAYVDDTWWGAKSYEEMNQITTSANLFFYYMGIVVNPLKTKLIVINENIATQEIPFTFGNPAQVIKRSRNDKGERLLGIYISEDGLHKTQKQIIDKDILAFISLVSKRVITDQICIYLINMVLIPAIVYRNKLLPLTRRECEKYDEKLACLVKMKTGQASTILTDIVHQETFYNVKKLYDAISEAVITEYTSRLNGNSETSKACNIVEGNLSEAVNLPMNCHNYITLVSGKNNEFIPKVLKILKDKSMTFTSTNTNSELTQLVNVIKSPKIFHTMNKVLMKCKIRYLDEFLDKSGRITLTWFQATKRRGAIPAWYRSFIAAIAIIDKSSVTENFLVKPEWTPAWNNNPFNNISITLKTNEINERRSVRIQANNPYNERRNYGFLPDEVNNIIDNTNKQRFGTLDTSRKIEIGYQDIMVLNKKDDMSNKLDLKMSSFFEYKVEDNTNELSIYTDGSLTHQGTPDVSMGCGILILEPLDDDKEITDIPRIESYGQLEGEASSFKSELMGVYTALEIVSGTPDRRITIYLDNEGVVKKFESEMNLKATRIAKIVRSTSFTIWDAIRKLVHQRQGWVRLKWIKGHSVNKGNNHVDTLAGRHGLKSDIMTNLIKTPCRSVDMENLKVIAKTNKTLIESDIRKTVKNISKIANANQYTKSKTFKAIGLQDVNDRSESKLANDWCQTSKIINQGVKITSSYTNKQISDSRTYMIKAFHGLLPTASILHQRAPLTYESPYCKRCSKEHETNEHLWNCKSASKERKHIIKEARTILVNKLKDVKPRIALDEINLINDVIDTFAVFRKKNQSSNKSKLAMKRIGEIDETSVIRTNRKNARRYRRKLQSQGELISFQHLCRGIVPIAIKNILTRLCKYLLKSTSHNDTFINNKSIKIAGLLSARIAKHISDEARERIWKPRCSEFVEWEEGIGITNIIKTSTAHRKAREDEMHVDVEIIEHDERLMDDNNTQEFDVNDIDDNDQFELNDEIRIIGDDEDVFLRDQEPPDVQLIEGIIDIPDAIGDEEEDNIPRRRKRKNRDEEYIHHQREAIDQYVRVRNGMDDMEGVAFFKKHKFKT